MIDRSSEQKLMVNVLQLILGFHFWSQGMPRIIWGQESQMTMNLIVSVKDPEVKEITVIQQMVLLLLGVPSML